MCNFWSKVFIIIAGSRIIYYNIYLHQVSSPSYNSFRDTSLSDILIDIDIINYLITHMYMHKKYLNCYRLYSRAPNQFHW